MLKDKNKLVAELDWLNWKSYMLCWVGALIVGILIVIGTPFFAVGWYGAVLGFAAWVVVTWVQKRMARKLADKIMQAHLEDLTITVDLRKLNFKK